MKHLYTILFISFFCGAVGLSSSAQQVVCGEYDSNRLLAYSDEDSIEVTGKDGIINNRTSRSVEVTVYTILGQKVMACVVNPGVTELKIGSRGVYLVKIEGRTQKVAL